MHRSGGRKPAVRLPIVWPARLRTYSETLVPRSAKSGGRKPAVGSGNALGQALPQLLGRLPTGVLAHSVAVALPRTTGGLRPPRSCSRAFARRRNCDFSDAQTHIRRSGGRKPAVVALATPQRRSTRHSHAAIAPGNSSGGRQPAVCCADALAKALPQLFGRLSPVRWRTPLQSRPCNYAGLTPPALGRARSPVDAIATFAMHKRTCTGAAGVSPPWVDDAHARKIANRK